MALLIDYVRRTPRRARRPEFVGVRAADLPRDVMWDSESIPGAYARIDDVAHRRRPVRVTTYTFGIYRSAAAAAAGQDRLGVELLTISGSEAADVADEARTIARGYELARRDVWPAARDV